MVGLDTTCVIAKIVRQQFRNEISVHTVEWTLYFVELTVCVKVKKLLLLGKNIKACLKFIKSHVHLRILDLKRIVFSIEAKINNFYSDGRN